MSVHVPAPFPIRHIDCLPRPFAQALAAIILFFHGILIVFALKSIPFVELGGSAGSGNNGNKTLYITVLQSTSPAGISTERSLAHSTGQSVIKKEKTRSERVTSTAASPKIAPAPRTTETSSANPAKTGTTEQKSSPDLHPSSVSTAYSGTASNIATSTGTSRDTGNSAGNGSDDGKNTASGSGKEEVSGNGSGSGSTGNGPARSVSLSLLRYKRAVKPEYPARSIQRRESGQVNVRIVVDAAGRVHDARIAISSGFVRLDEAALKAARRSTFHPYMEHGRPVFAMAIVPYRFNLNRK